MRENRTVLIGVALVVLAIGLVFYLYNLEREHQEELKQSDRRAFDVESDVLETRTSRDLEVVLFFYRPGATGMSEDSLVAEKRSVFHTEEPTLTARQIVNELFKGPSEKGRAVFPEEAQLRQIFLLEDGTAVVDLAQQSINRLGGITGEQAAIHAITRSLRENIEEIERVKFLVEGHERPTLAGHVSISHPFM